MRAFLPLCLLPVLLLSVISAVTGAKPAAPKKPVVTITFLPPEQWPDRMPDNGFIRVIVRVSSSTGQCPPGQKLTLTYLGEDVSAFGEDNLRIFRYDPAKKAWTPLAGTIDTKNGKVTAAIAKPGIYTLSAITVPDKTPPVIRWMWPPAEEVQTGEAEIQVRTDDNIGIHKVIFFLDGRQIAEDFTAMDGGWATTINFARLVPGTHEVKVVVADRAGNTAEVTRKYTVKSVATAPVISLRGIAPDPAFPGFLLLTGKVMDADGDGEITVFAFAVDGKRVGIEDIEHPLVFGRARGETWEGRVLAELIPAGKHTLTVTIYDADGNPGSVTVNYEMPLTLQSVGLAAGPISPQSPNVPVRLTALTNGGKTVEYAFSVRDGAGLTVLREYGAEPACDWKPAQPGDYTLLVRAREAGSEAEVTGEIPFTIMPPLSAVALTADPDRQQTERPVQLTAAATGGAAVEYEFRVALQGEWTVLRPFDASPACEWLPTAPGTYQLQVGARDPSGTTVTSPPVPCMVTALAELAGVKLTANPPSPQPRGTIVQVKATPAAGTAVQYRFQVNDGKGWKVMSEFGGLPEIGWLPAEPGQYTLRVTAREEGGQPSFTQDLPYLVIPPTMTSVRLEADHLLPFTAGLCVTLVAWASASEQEAVNGEQMVYKFMVSDGKNWTTFQDFGKLNVGAWYPERSGKYTIRVVARETNLAGVKEMSADIPYEVKIVGLSVKMQANPPAPQPSDTPITLSAIGYGDAAMEFQFQVGQEGKGWTTVQDFSPKQTFVWTPKAPGKYWLQVFAREPGQETKYQDGMGFEVK